MKTKAVPIVITLIAAAVACLFSLIQQVDFSVFVFRLLSAVIIFAIVGVITKIVLDFVFNKRVSEDETIYEDEEDEEEDEDNDREEGYGRNPEQIDFDEEYESSEYEEE